MQIIDFHVHAGDFHRLRDDIQMLLTARPMEPDIAVHNVFSTRESLEEYLGRYGVVRAMVLAECGPGTNFSIDSELISRIVGDSQMLVPFGSINPNFHTNPVTEWWRSVGFGIRGFKFYPADHGFDPLDAGMMAVYRLCERAGMPVMFHTGPTAQRDAAQRFIHPHDFLPVIEECPNLVVILAHAGKPDWCEEALVMTERFDNVYVDTGLVDLSRLVVLGIESRPARHKVLFGSDWPVCGSYAALLLRCEKADLSGPLRDLIFYANAAHLLERIFAAQTEARDAMTKLSIEENPCTTVHHTQ